MSLLEDRNNRNSMSGVIPTGIHTARARTGTPTAATVNTTTHSARVRTPAALTPMIAVAAHMSVKWDAACPRFDASWTPDNSISERPAIAGPWRASTPYPIKIHTKTDTLSVVKACRHQVI